MDLGINIQPLKRSSLIILQNQLLTTDDSSVPLVGRKE
ncbi:NADH dehydrogenase (ubiquinone) 1 beta subcomplex, 5 (predicted), isoform CRA_d [Rattus norvegicus]|uniref:NADH dehydrogenase (Ubiquinone) 1 beta subcomplex, 5 (Predicted), isoform CRA_d n=1 Tax=Rattus norvegicus TaxID=10116 RepID=A6IHR2_RAT|nr:NADH dehydrogenase (ubiquinone) 1 beta subcomplex, 5 (predicted), isoform CRA_d [Rattus norvegicus]